MRKSAGFFIAIFLLTASLPQAFVFADSAALPLPLAQTAQDVRLPRGFKVSLFAGEPDVEQPIAMAFDDRGRLWVAECFTYSNAKTNFDLHLRDRILIFEDSHGTGHFDKRTVFWDQGVRLTSIAPGFGGVYALCAPNLIFIPDRNGDDVPDGPPEVLLNGWDADKVRHNIVNGLKWGPDGWLYGRHGIMATSSVGKPGTPEEERVKLNCGIWRYHPTRKVFEVVCHGTTNPWGSDWDEHGRMFFINTVIGHLWQAIPGAFFKRMYGEPLVPFRYGLMDQAADHYHWDTGHTWQDSRSAPSSDALGGGHAHSGLMIYQGQNWPTQYRGGAFMLNYHGRRINEDRLEPLDSGAVGRHAPDLARFEDPWFRGIDLDYGPDGSVYVLDWSDTGECHGTDNVNRDSGRIYRISWAGTNSAPQPSDSPSLVASLRTNGLALASADELLQMQLQPNEWFARHSRRLLQERATAGALPAHFASRILALFEQTSNGVEKLRLLFTLHDIGGDSRDWLLSQLGAQDEFLRGWAVRFLAETSAQDRGVQAAFARLAKAEPSPIVRLELASALQRLALADREGVAAALLDHAEDQKDRYLPLMLWYGVEPVTAKFPTDAIRLAAGSKIPIVRQYISRRLGDMMAKRPEAVNDLLRDASLWPAAQQIDVLRGLAEALGKTGHATMPSQWMALRERTAASRNDELVELTRSLGAIFGDPWAIASLTSAALDVANSPETRRAALHQLVEAHPHDVQITLRKLLDDKDTAGAAARGLLLQNDPQIPEEVLKRWSLFDSEDRNAIVGLFATRASFASALLDAIGRGEIPRTALNVPGAQQILDLHRPELAEKLAKVWGTIHSSNAEKLQTMARYRQMLTPEVLKNADLSHGRAIFQQVCALCHKLYGQGASIGPDLTGGGRADLEYLLQNVVDPSAIVPASYQVIQLELKDDRSVSGLVVEKTDTTITMQTPTQKLVIPKSDIASTHQSALSLMPEGLLQSMKDDQVRDLLAYLMAPHQVPLAH